MVSRVRAAKSSKMTVEDASEGAQVAGVREGEALAFAELFRRHQGELWTLVSSVCEGEEGAEELLRETAMAAWAEAARAELPAGPWLRRVCARVLFRQARGDSRPEALPAPLFDADGLRVEEMGAWPPPELVGDRDGVRRAVRDVLARLPLRDRVAWALSDLGQMPVSEIARVAQEASSEVRRAIHRARLALREQLEAFFQRARNGASLGEPGRASPG